MLKKFTTLLLVIIMLTFSACGEKLPDSSSAEPSAPSDTVETSDSLQFLFCENDTMNPYKTISKLNAELASLLFDPLVKIDDSFEVINILAQRIETVDNICTVTIKDAVFSDGTAVTADDIVYSCSLAKACDRFSYLFYEVADISAADAKTVVFTLNTKDPYFYKLLTFPILKTGSDQLRNEDNVELTPIGCGKFVFDQTGTKLIPNISYSPKVSNIKEIKLVNAPDDESMRHHVEVGVTDIYYAETPEDTIIRMSGKKQTVNLNNLIYLGINHNYAPLKKAELRYAISSAISRDEIRNSAFYSNAVSASGFFHPDWNEVADYQTIEASANLKISVEYLNKIGYNRLNEDGYYENSHGNILELSLLVNGDNATKSAAAMLIANQLKASGIKINVNSVGKDAYFSALASGSFQLYIGEIKLLPNMDIRSLVMPGGSAAYGMVTEALEKAPESPDETQDEAMENDDIHDETSYIKVIENFYAGSNTVVDVASSLLATMPVIPIIYRNSIVFYSNDIEDISSISCSDIFLSIDKYKVKK